MAILKRLHHKVTKASQIRRDFGFRAVLQYAANVVGLPLCHFEATTIVWLSPERMNIALDLPDDTQMRFLTADEVATFAEDPQYAFKESLVRKSQFDSDLCFAAFVDGTLASYGWYTLNSEVPADDFGLMMSVPPNAAYMHNGFTHPDFRGRRLHGIGMGRALHALTDRGIDALLSDVDWANHASLRSCRRLGYDFLGNLYAIGRPWRCSVSPRAARSLGVTFDRRSQNDIQADEHRPLAVNRH